MSNYIKLDTLNNKFIQKTLHLHCPPPSSLSTSILTVHLHPHCPPSSSLSTSILTVHLHPHCPPPSSLSSLSTSILTVHLHPHCPPPSSLSTHWRATDRGKLGVSFTRHLPQSMDQMFKELSCLWSKHQLSLLSLE